MPTQFVIALDPQQLPWLLALLTSYARRCLDPPNVYADPETRALRESFYGICDTAQTVYDQIIEQMRG